MTLLLYYGAILRAQVRMGVGETHGGRCMASEGAWASAVDAPLTKRSSPQTKRSSAAQGIGQAASMAAASAAAAAAARYIEAWHVDQLDL